MSSVRRVRFLVFLKDVFVLSFTSFGGPQAHIAHFHKHLVERRRYLPAEELQELHALCQVLPGPTSTQTLCAIGQRLGGAKLAYLTLLIWALPSVILMMLAGILVANFDPGDVFPRITRYIQPMAIGFVAYAAWTMIQKSVNTKSGLGIMVAAATASFFFRTPWVFPLTLVIAGALTSFKYKKQPAQENQVSGISWNNFILWAGVLVFAAVLGAVTGAMPVRLFENFYRNGSLVFGGGQALTPLLYTEFVQYAKPLPGGEAAAYVSPENFLSGFGLVQSLPGPLFSFSAYLGVLAMHSRGYGIAGEITGGLFSAAGIFLPGTFLIFFLIRVWEMLKKYRPIRASLEGIAAANAGLIAAAAVILFLPLENNLLNYGMTIGTFMLLTFTRIPSWTLIPAGLIVGVLLS